MSRKMHRARLKLVAKWVTYSLDMLGIELTLDTKFKVMTNREIALGLIWLYFFFFVCEGPSDPAKKNTERGGKK